MPLYNPGAWGHLRERYESEKPRKMLALDGGGIRGILTLQILKEIETQLSRSAGTGKSFRLCDYFDFVGGTSTGAIIAAAIARGLSVDEIISFYEEFGHEVFKKRRWGIWESLYGDGALAKKLQEVYGANTTLVPDDLKTLLLAVTRNATTDSVWPVSSNPAAKYNDVNRPDCNLKIPLWKLVRASTAAPAYFPAEVIEWQEGNPDKAFVFVDGGTTSYNNPAFLMSRLATAPEYRLNWERGEDKLLVVSLGTGSAPKTGNDAEDPNSNLVASAAKTLSALMSQAAFDQDVNCRTIGRCTFGLALDREVGDLVPRDAAGVEVPLSKSLGRAFTYVRYDAQIDREGLDAMGLSDIDPKKIGKLDSVDAIDDLSRVGRKVAESVTLEHIGAFARPDG